MPSPDSPGPRAIAKAESLLRLALIVAPLLFLAFFAFLAARHLVYPFELEWMEGSMADHVNRLLHGQQIYVPPSIDFAPHGYPFGYFYASAALAKLLGMGFLPLRLVSVLATLVSFGTIFLLVRRETGSAASGLLAAGACAATYKLGGSFFDVARIDALFLAIFLVAMYLTRFASSGRAALLAGTIYGLSFLTKQVSLVFAPAFLLYVLLFKRRLLLPYALAMLVTAGGGTLLFDLLHDGWYSFYTITFQTGRKVQLPVLLLFIKRDLAPVLLAGAFGLFHLLSRFTWRRDVGTGAFYLLVFGGVVGGCGVSRSLSLGAFTNVLMPAYAMFAIALALGLHEALRCAREAAAVPRWQALGPFVLLLAALQLVVLSFDPRGQLPTAADRAAGDRLVEWTRSFEGEVFLVGQGFLATYAGKPSHVHTVGIIDSWSNPVTRPYIEKSVTEALHARRFAAVVTTHAWDADPRQWFIEALRAGYTLQGEFFDEPRVFEPVTGVRLRPTHVYLPRP